MRKKSIIRRLIPWILILGALAALIVFVFIPIYSSDEKSFGRDTRIIYFEGDGKPVSMENDQLLFEMDGETTLFTVTDKKTGKVWYSNPEKWNNDTIANGVNKEYLACSLSLTYYDKTSQFDMNNYTHSIKNQSFEIKQEDDGAVRVNYSLGKNAGKRYLYPNAITKERYEAFRSNLEKKQQKKLGNYFVLYEPSKLDKKSNKDEIIAMYPSVTEQALYIAKSDLDNTKKLDCESIFAAAGYTEEDYAIDQELMAGEKDTAGPVFDISVIYRLEGNDLVVSVPYDEICCAADYPIIYLNILPMFGAGSKDQSGFIFVPEGGGAIINFNNGKLSQSAYYANMYGWDYGTTRTSVVSETENAFSVFGISHEDGSFICIMEGAESYGGVSADIAGRLNNYNTVYGKYNVIHYDSVKVDAQKSANLLLMYEDAIPNDTLVQRYRFLPDTDYVSMAILRPNTYHQISLTLPRRDDLRGLRG